MNIIQIHKPQIGLTGREVKGSPEYVLLTHLNFTVACNDHSMSFTIPKGFKYDSASLPRLAQLFWNKSNPEILCASAAHDFWYSQPSRGDLTVLTTHDMRRVLITRREIDIIFRELLIALSFPVWQAYLFYYAVRLFGSSHFNKSQKYEK